MGPRRSHEIAYIAIGYQCCSKLDAYPVHMFVSCAIWMGYPEPKQRIVEAMSSSTCGPTLCSIKRVPVHLSTRSSCLIISNIPIIVLTFGLLPSVLPTYLTIESFDHLSGHASHFHCFCNTSNQ